MLINDFGDYISLVADKENENVRIDLYLSEKLKFSRTKIQNLIDSGNIKVNGISVKKNYLLKESDKVSVRDFENEEIDALPENIPLDIVYEDRDIIVVNKPQGMVVHPACGNYTGTLVNALLYHCKDSLSGINGKIRPGIVHRIDKDTSGLLVCAKNDDAHEKLAEMISSHDFVREYVAVVYSSPKCDSGTIELAIGRSKKDRKKMDFYPFNTPNTKNAVTHYKVLEKFKGYSLVRFTLETGRTHQIRVHSLSMHTPVVGDPVYAKGRENFGLSGQCLHAQRMAFKHPITNEYLDFISDYPQYFKDIINLLRTRYSADVL